MNWALFFSTFVLIFLAELGDKTQLAAMARVAGGAARWTVFLAASLALILSTLVAVLLGDALTRFVPERVIRIAAATLFVGFGLLLFWQALADRPLAQPKVGSPPGLVSRFVFRQAVAFERAALANYRRLAEQTGDARTREVLGLLAADEQAHLERIRRIAHAHPEGVSESSVFHRLPGQETLLVDADIVDRPVVEHAIRHEIATENFYRELANLTLIPALRKAFQELAAEEHLHRERLQAMVSRVDPKDG